MPPKFWPKFSIFSNNMEAKFFLDLDGFDEFDLCMEFLSNKWGEPGTVKVVSMNPEKDLKATPNYDFIDLLDSLNVEQTKELFSIYKRLVTSHYLDLKIQKEK